MRSRIKPSKLQLLKRSVFRGGKRWLILIFGLLGITLIWQSYGWINFKSAAIDLPNYATDMKRVDWNEYSKIGQAVSELTSRWKSPNSSFSNQPIRNFEQKISKESLEAQTGQIKHFFAEEEAFRKADLEKSLEKYRYKLDLEMARELDVETNRLRARYQKQALQRELNLKNAVSKYNDELDAEYQVILANLQLQLLIVDL